MICLWIVIAKIPDDFLVEIVQKIAYLACLIIVCRFSIDLVLVVYSANNIAGRVGHGKTDGKYFWASWDDPKKLKNQKNLINA